VGVDAEGVEQERDLIWEMVTGWMFECVFMFSQANCTRANLVI